MDTLLLVAAFIGHTHHTRPDTVQMIISHTPSPRIYLAGEWLRVTSTPTQERPVYHFQSLRLIGGDGAEWERGELYINRHQRRVLVNFDNRATQRWRIVSK